MNNTKTCSKCNQSLPLFDFYVQRIKKDGSVKYHPFCKDCTKQYNRDRYATVESYREKRKQREKNLSPEQLAKKKQTSEKHYESTIGRAKRLLSGSKHRALENNLEYDLDFEFIHERIAAGYCSVTGLPFDLKKPVGTVKNAYSPSLDRIDHTRGYTKDNVRVVIWQFNMMKGELTDRELQKLCAIVAERLKNGLDL